MRALRRVPAIAIAAVLWVIVVVAAGVWRRQVPTSELPLALLCAASGILGGSLTSLLTSASRGRASPVSVILLLMPVGIGLNRYLRGDPGGLILFSMFAGAAVGTLGTHYWDRWRNA
ncbi:MAG TPA: DUF1275 family protein [Armatimonadota bacterium]|nr:DUF1275 family protein [Armatimonadota bacterium]